jgi:hypothetical protein
VPDLLEAPLALVDHLVQDALALNPVGVAGSFGVLEIELVGRVLSGALCRRMLRLRLSGGVSGVGWLMG